MKRTVSLILIYSLCAIAALSQQSGTPSPNAVVHVATALNHLTVLEFHEPVTMAAAGSSDFQIEREANKVFVKPIKSGAATDLFVWTASRRFAYELEITQEVKEMNFAIDTAQPVPAPAPKPVVETDTDQFADVVLTRALMGAEEIKQRSPRKAKGQVSVRVEQVFRTREYGLYPLHDREQQRPLLSREYATGVPAADRRTRPFRSQASRTLSSTEPCSKSWAIRRELALPVAHSEAEADDLHPGESTQGVVSIRKDLKSPAVIQLVFRDGVKATFVL